MLKKILLFLVVLLFAVLACSIPQKGDDIKLNGTVTHSAPTPVNKVDAKEAIQAYAQDVLGFEISNLFAGGTAG